MVGMGPGVGAGYGMKNEMALEFWKVRREVGKMEGTMQLLRRGLKVQAVRMGALRREC